MDSNTVSQSRFLRAIPVVMLAVFVLFWSSVDIIFGHYLMIWPSALILAALAFTSLRKERR